MKRIAPIALAGLLLLACTPDKDQNTQPGPFEHAYAFQPLVDSLWRSGLSLEKTLLKDDQVETIRLDNLDSSEWQQVWQVWTQVEFNTPQNREKYRLDSAIVPLAGIARYTYRTTDSSLSVKTAEYEYQNGVLQQAYLVVRQQNELHGYEQHLHYRKGIGFDARLHQSITQVLDESASVQVRLIPSEVPYRGFLLREDRAMPVHLWVRQGSKPELTFVNGSERIPVKAVQGTGDTLVYRMPVFQTEFRLVNRSGSLEGYWYNLSGTSGYRLPFRARPDTTFDPQASFSSFSAPLNGTWRVQIDRGDRITEAMGLFERYENRVFGTFLTRSGDYRHLEGKVRADSFYLSGFDGSHAYMFIGKFVGNDSISGIWYSGRSFRVQWYAQRDADYRLPDPDTLTYLKEGFDRLSFSFPDVSGNPVSLEDDRFLNKVVIVTIMGSWCPNCMDEARYLREVYERYQPQGLEIVGLSFERGEEADQVLPKIRKMVEDVQIPYTVLWAGKASGKAAAEALPMLNHVISFPTTIYVGRDGTVKKVHTGFRGPGTGKLYEEFVAENEVYLKELLAQ